MVSSTDADAPALLDAADKLLEFAAGELPPGCDAELYVCREQDRGIQIKEGHVEVLEESADEGFGLRILKDSRMAFGHGAGLTVDGLKILLPQLLQQLRHVQPDEHRVFAKQTTDQTSDPKIFAETVDQTLFLNPLQNQVAKLKNMEETALRRDPRLTRVLNAAYGESRSEVAIVNTLGLRRHESGTGCSVGLEAVAEKGSQIQVGSASQSSRFYRHLDFDKAAQDAAFRAGSLLDSQKLPTAKRAVVFDPWVAGEFIELIAGALAADQVQRGKSLFRGKIGQSVASGLVDLVDDPRRKFGLASAAFDDEGVPTRRKVMIERGVLKEYFYDLASAHKDGRESNGCCGRPSYKGTGSPSPSNFFMEAGPITRERLLSGTENGVLVLEALGMHTADPVTGEFSVGISGIAIENGRLTHGVRGAMLSGSVLELLAGIDAVADDLTFYGSLAAPTFRVAGMTVA